MGTKMAVSFANIFMAAVETEIIERSSKKPLIWKRYIDDVFSLWNLTEEEITAFIELANNYHPPIKFTAEISDTEITFLDTCVYRIQGRKIQGIIYSRRSHALQTDRNFPIHALYILPPSRRQERLYQRRSIASSENRFLKSYF